MSSEASTIIRRAMKRASSPPSSVAALVVDERPLARGVLDVLFGQRDALGTGRLSRQLEDVVGVPRIAAGAARDQGNELRRHLDLQRLRPAADDLLELVLAQRLQ